MRKKSLKHFLYRLFYVIMVIFIIVLGDSYFTNLKQEFYRFELSYYRYYNLKLIFLVFIGIVLGLPQLISEFNKWGLWKFDSLKLTSMGLPLLLILVFPLVKLPPINLPNFLTQLYMYLFVSSPTLNTVSGVAFGYILVTSFAKKRY